MQSLIVDYVFNRDCLDGRQKTRRNAGVIYAYLVVKLFRFANEIYKKWELKVQARNLNF